MGWLFHFPGVRMVTGTPRRAVRSSSESRLRSGRKYGEQMRIDSRAEATRIWKRSRARVERPEEGVLFTTMPTALPGGTTRGSSGRKSANSEIGRAHV